MRPGLEGPRMGKHFKAIVAMARNRVMGKDNQLPWHIPEELRWFKQMTTGQVIIMGRKTWESIGRALPNRETIVVSRALGSLPDARVIRDLSELDPESDPREYYIVGGARLFAEALPLCSDVYLTVVKREVEGDVRLPPFEDQFESVETIRDTPEFAIYHYRRGSAATAVRTRPCRPV